jgi:hypothetical protein
MHLQPGHEHSDHPDLVDHTQGIFCPDGGLHRRNECAWATADDCDGKLFGISACPSGGISRTGVRRRKKLSAWIVPTTLLIVIVMGGCGERSQGPPSSAMVAAPAFNWAVVTVQ